MSNIKWVLTLEKTLISHKGETLDVLEDYEFNSLEQATEAKHMIDGVGVLDSLDDDGSGVYFKVIRLEAVAKD